jgi:UDP-glucuronate 4-epimerase
MQKVFITGVAGFIGFHLTQLLSKNKNIEILGMDNINDYYSVQLKHDRLILLGFDINKLKDNTKVDSLLFENIEFIKRDLKDYELLRNCLMNFKPDIIINLAAQPGVRYSLINPRSYINSNVNGLFNILEISKELNIQHLIYASSSSVYGGNTNYPYSEEDNTDFPLSLYAASKKADELMAYSYSYNFGLQTTGLRFFSVYGPWGRPDMMPMLTIESILNNREITLYDNGELWRDYTYIDDTVEGINRLFSINPAELSNSKENVKWRIFNIGRGHPVKNIDFIKTIENELDKKAIIKNVPAPKTEAFKTFANTQKLKAEINYSPSIDINNGIKQLVKWYKEYNRID